MIPFHQSFIEAIHFFSSFHWLVVVSFGLHNNSTDFSVSSESTLYSSSYDPLFCSKGNVWLTYTTSLACVEYTTISHYVMAKIHSRINRGHSFVPTDVGCKAKDFRFPTAIQNKVSEFLFYAQEPIARMTLNFSELFTRSETFDWAKSSPLFSCVYAPVCGELIVCLFDTWSA